VTDRADTPLVIHDTGDVRKGTVPGRIVLTTIATAIATLQGRTSVNLVDWSIGYGA
jgi:hypothetical protein